MNTLGGEDSVWVGTMAKPEPSSANATSTNVAKIVDVQQSSSDPSNPSTATKENLTDGDRSTGGKTKSVHRETITIELDKLQPINSIFLAALQGEDQTLNSFALEYSADGIKYTNLISDVHGSFIGNRRELSFDKVNARYIRLEVLVDGRYIAISEFSAKLRATGKLNSIQSSLTVDMGAGTSDRLWLDDAGAQMPNVATPTSGRVAGLGMGAGPNTTAAISFSNVSEIDLFLAGGTTANVLGTSSADTETYIHSGPSGTTTVNIHNDGRQVYKGQVPPDD